jgi:hypothetical protein
MLDVPPLENLIMPQLTIRIIRQCAMAVCGASLAGMVYAQTDEIQVYDASIAEEGKLSFDLHNNFTPAGRKASDMAHGIVPNHALNGTAEFGYGVTDWFEAGLYLPVYSIRADGRAEVDSAKLRALFVSPDAAHREVFYGVNFELSYNAFHWEPTRLSGEIRPIIGTHLGAWDVIFNPIIDSGFQGAKHLDFAPAGRIAYNLSPVWSLALEHYADFGQFSALAPLQNQAQTLFGVVDYKADGAGSVEFGVGHGLTQASDDVVLKLILGFEL